MILHMISVGLGGFLGAMARFAVSRWMINKPGHLMPYGTLMINLLGAFLLGCMVGDRVSQDTLLLLGTGFIGTFTTFSTLNWEAFRLAKSVDRKSGLLYLAVSYSAGMLLAFVGLWLGSSI